LTLSALLNTLKIPVNGYQKGKENKVICYRGKNGNVFHFKELTMKSTRRKKTAAWLAGLLGLTLALVILTQITMATDLTADQQQSARPPRPQPKVKVGQLAPDFELPYLVLSNDAAGKPIGKINDNNKLRLSSLFGTKPICMIMSSYT
jgi:hypothetical protein